MENNLDQIEIWTLFLHLKEWLKENENYKNSDNFELLYKWNILEKIYNKIKLKI